MSLESRVLGIRVPGSGFRVLDIARKAARGFRVYGIRGFGFTVSGLRVLPCGAVGVVSRGEGFWV